MPVSIEQSRQAAIAAIDANAEALVSLSKFIHANPETGLQEFKCSAACVDFLQTHGFEVERNVSGLETAFAARAGDSGPSIAFLAEYDALAGIGHGCGHNLIAIANLAAGLGLKAAIDQVRSGRVVVFGTPAEESFGGKAIMAKAGAFDGIDAALGAHPGTSEATCPTVEGSGRSLARQEFLVAFHGKPAHAAADPYNGINALDALTLFYNGVSALRQQTSTDARFHGIITDGGDAPNVIPHYAATKYRARAATIAYMETLIEKVQRIGEGAALMTGCRFEFVRTVEPYFDMITNHTLARQVKLHLDELGFVQPEATAAEPAGSTDWGNASYAAPSVETSFPIMTGTCTWHSQAVVDASDSELAYANTLTVAKALALTGIDLISDPALLAAVRQEFDRSLGQRAAIA
jgi:amidohydrolase